MSTNKYLDNQYWEIPPRRMQKKKSQFRQQIRRKQINEILKSKRLHFHQEQRRVKQNMIKQIYKEEILAQFQTMLSCLSKYIVGREFYLVAQTLKDINQLIKKQCQYAYIRSYVGNSTLLEQLVKGLCEVSSKMPDDERQNLCSQILKALSNIIDFEDITSQNIRKSKLIEQLRRILQFPSNSAEYISNVLWVIGISMDKNPMLAQIVADEQLVDSFIYILVQLEPDLEDELLHHFLLFLKLFLQQISEAWVPKFTLQQIEVLFKATYPTIFLFNSHGFTNQIQNIVMEDSVYVLKMLLQRKIIKFSRSDIEYNLILQIFHLQEAPHQLKKQIMYLLDYAIYADKNNFVTEELVCEYELLKHIWRLQQEDERIISLNILANIALIPSLKFKLTDFLPYIILELHFSPHHVVFIFILNYFHSQDYDIQTPSDEKIVRRLQEIKQTTPQIILTEVKIWLALLMHGFQGVIPQRIFHASCEEAELLRQLRDKNTI